MKILTWNIERLKTLSNKEKIISLLQSYDADILVLTETSELIKLPRIFYKISSSPLPELHDGIKYNNDENRVTIWSRYPLKPVETSDMYTTVCADIETDLGSLRVFGTIIGVFGGRGKRFKDDLEVQLVDYDKLLSDKNSCIIGDLNTTFSGFVYPSYTARQIIVKCFKKMNLINLTASIPNNVDHIAISEELITSRNIEITLFNEDKALSDHIGICITIT